MIELTLGQFYNKNRTTRYILPIVNAMSNEFKYHFELVFKGLIACAIGDIKYDMAKGKEVEYALFVLHDMYGAYDINASRHVAPDVGLEVFKRWLKFVRKFRYYMDDYFFKSLHAQDDLSVQSHLCCTIIALPKEYRNAFDAFKKSQYSKMYTKKQLETELKISPVRSDNSINPIWAVLTKQPEYKQEFNRLLNEHFNTTVTIDDDREYDISLDMSNEKFNMQ